MRWLEQDAELGGKARHARARGRGKGRGRESDTACAARTSQLQLFVCAALRPPSRGACAARRVAQNVLCRRRRFLPASHHNAVARPAPARRGAAPRHARRAVEGALPHAHWLRVRARAAHRAAPAAAVQPHRAARRARRTRRRRHLRQEPEVRPAQGTLCARCRRRQHGADAGVCVGRRVRMGVECGGDDVGGHALGRTRGASRAAA